jgi:hypothetical protein
MSGYGIEPSYWNLCGAMFAYVSGKLAELGIDAVGASQLVGHPSQYPSVSLLDWNTGSPNARYDALKLLIDNVFPGDRFADSSFDSPDIYVLPTISRNGQRKLLIVNKTSHDLETNIAGDALRQEVHVDATAPGLQMNRKINSTHIVLHPFAVMSATLSPEVH